MHQLRTSTDPNSPCRTLVWMLHEDVTDNTVKAFNVSATWYTQAAPAGRYVAPANGGGCLEAATVGTSVQQRYGDYGSQSVIVTGPQVLRVDIRVGQRIPIAGQLAPSHVGSTKDSFQVNTAVDQSRTMPPAFRISF
jgi:hypothetical protein